MRILSPEQHALIGDERRVLASLRDELVQLHASPDAQDALAGSIEQLDELFLLVVVGEFNSGKSAFINALLGQRLLKEGVTPTTAQVNVLQYGSEPGRASPTPHLHLVTAPVDLLREIHIVDTPGTNAVIREHEAITAEFVPRSDLVLFVTSADRPFTESERALPRGDPRVGQEDRHRPQQGRPARARRGGRATSSHSSASMPAGCSASPRRSFR